MLAGQLKIDQPFFSYGACPDFSPTKSFAGRDTGHEAVVFYRSLRYLQMPGNEEPAKKSFGPKGELFDEKRKTSC